MSMDNNQGSTTPSLEINPKEKISAWLRLGVLILTGIFIFVNPFPHTTAIAEISFYLAAAIVLALSYNKKITFTLRTPVTVPFGLFLVWGLFGLLFALNKANSIHDIYAHLIKYLFFFYVLVNFFSSRQKFIYLTWIIIISTTVFGAWLMIHDYIVLGRAISTKLGLISIDEIPSNIVGIITLFGLLLSLYLLKEEKRITGKLLLLVSLIILTLATLATQTRGTLIALIISLILSFFRNRKIVAVFFLFLVLAIGFLPVKNCFTIESIKSKITGDSRVQVWRMYGEIVKDYPLMGVGFGMQTFYDDNLLAKYNARVPAKHRLVRLFNAPHNMFVDTAARVGIVGLLLFFYTIFAFIRMGIKTAAKGRNDFIKDWGNCLIAAFIAFFTQGLFENVLSGHPAIVLYTILGMMTILWRINEEPPEPT